MGVQPKSEPPPAAARFQVPTPARAALVAVLVYAFLVGVSVLQIGMSALGGDTQTQLLLTRGGGLVAMSFGLIITVVVQSSSITTSLLIPLAASGVLSIRAAYPVTLGANVGTTITALLAAMAASRPEALAIALVHTLFNVAGILLIYPLPFTRMLPVTAAEHLAVLATRRRSLALGWVIGTFLVLPLVLLVFLG